MHWEKLLDTTCSNPETSVEHAQVTVKSLQGAEQLLPSAEQFMALIEDEEKVTAHHLSGYSVYHKYNKSC